MQKRKTSSAPSSILGQDSPGFVVNPSAAGSVSSAMDKKNSKTKLKRVLVWVCFAASLALFQVTTFGGHSWVDYHFQDIFSTRDDKNWASSSNHETVVSSLRQRSQGLRRKKKKSVFTPAEATESSSPIQPRNKKKKRRKSVFTPMKGAEPQKHSPKKKKSVLTPTEAVEATEAPKPFLPVPRMRKTRKKSVFTPF